MYEMRMLVGLHVPSIGVADEHDRGMPLEKLVIVRVPDRRVVHAVPPPRLLGFESHKLVEILVIVRACRENRTHQPAQL